jgi:hypothetical protein
MIIIPNKKFISYIFLLKLYNKECLMNVVDSRYPPYQTKSETREKKMKERNTHLIESNWKERDSTLA